MKTLLKLLKPLNFIKVMMAFFLLIIFVAVETAFLLIYYVVETPLDKILTLLDKAIRITIKHIR